MSDFDRDTSAGYLTNHMARLFARHLDAGIRPLGLSLGAFPALLHLWEKDGLTQKELVERLHIEQPTMANTLARMERDGLLRRVKDEADARIQRIWLTEKGRAMEREATRAALAVNARALDDLSEVERAQFLNLMRRVILTLNR